MKTKFYDNGNLHVTRTDDKKMKGCEALMRAVALSNDNIEYVRKMDGEHDPEFEMRIDGKPAYYKLFDNDIDAFNQRKRIVIRRTGLAPQFIMPSFYKTIPYEMDKKRGTIYVLEKKPAKEVLDAMNDAGCTVLVVQAQYAPELKRCGVFVPSGTAFSFC